MTDFNKGNVKARLRMVAQYAVAGDNGLLVIEDGVAAGERVVIDGHLRLTPGAVVEEKASRERAGETRKAR